VHIPRSTPRGEESEEGKRGSRWWGAHFQRRNGQKKLKNVVYQRGEGRKPVHDAGKKEPKKSGNFGGAGTK